MANFQETAYSADEKCPNPLSCKNARNEDSLSNSSFSFQTKSETMPETPGSPVTATESKAKTNPAKTTREGQVKNTDVYFKIWNKMDSKKKIPTVAKISNKPSELDKCVAEYSNSDVRMPHDCMRMSESKRNINEGPDTLQQNLGQSSLQRRKRKSMLKGSHFCVEEPELPDPKDDLEQMAMNEILKEAKRGAERSTTMGPAGWLKPPTSTNKRFLTNTLMSTLQKPFTSKEVKHYEQDVIRLNYGVKGSHWSKKEKTLMAPETSERSTRKHDFYCYYLPEDVIQRKLEKKKKKKQSSTKSRSDSVDNSVVSMHINAEQTSESKTEKAHGKDSSKISRSSKKGLIESSVSSYSSSVGLLSPDSELLAKKHNKSKKKHHKHKKSKKHKTYKDRLMESSCSEDSTHGKREISGDLDQKNHKHRRKRHKHKHQHQEDHAASQSGSDCSWDKWDATNYKDGWEVTRKKSKKRKRSFIDH